jgi:hypothetical protein
MSLARRCGLTAIVASLLVGITLAQGPRWPGKPANPGPGEMRRSYSQSGTVGRGYRPLSTWTYQNTARVNAQSLYLYGENCPDVEPATIREHVAEIRRNVTAAKKELDKLDEQTIRDSKIAEEVDALRKNYESIETHCGMAEKCITSKGVDAGKLCECCGSLEDELDAAHKTHQKMLDKLGIKQVEPGPATGKEAKQKK